MFITSFLKPKHHHVSNWTFAQCHWILELWKHNLYTRDVQNLLLEGPTEFSSNLPQHTCIEVSSKPKDVDKLVHVC